MSFAGRIEALVSVPSGVSVSASNSGATSVSLTAGDYFWTAAGSVSGLAAHFQSQLNASRAPSSGAWTVTVSTTTGQLSIGCSGTTAIPSFSLAWTSTALRDACGFTRDIDYPKTAAQLTADLGYGTWTNGVGYLCNEASGNLAPVFGSGSLVATNTPTYGSTGPRGGTDKAVGCGASGSSLGSFVASDATLADVGATDDILVVVVVESFGSGGTFSYLPIKGDTAATPPYWRIVAGSNLQLSVHDGTDNLSASIATPTAPCVLVGALSRATNKMAFGAQTLISGGGGTQTVSALADASAIGSLSNSDFLRLGPGNNTSALKIAAFYVVTGSGVAIGVPENIATAVANFAATFGTRTGTKQVRGMWRPNAPLFMADNSTKHAPRITDLRTTIGPTGQTYSLSGNSRREQTSLKWSYVEKSQVWESDTTLANASWEQFLDDTQFGVGHAWFGVSSPVQIYDNAGFLVGQDANLDGWTILGVTSMNAKRTDARGYDGLWTIEIPRLVASD